MYVHSAYKKYWGCWRALEASPSSDSTMAGSLALNQKRKLNKGYMHYTLKSTDTHQCICVYRWVGEWVRGRVSGWKSLGYQILPRPPPSHVQCGRQSIVLPLAVNTVVNWP